MADVQIAVIDQQDTQIALAVPGVQGPIGLTGSVTIAQAGTAATPGIRFESDTNTGIYSPGADQLAVATNGTGRLFVSSAGTVGIDTNETNFNGQGSPLIVGNGSGNQGLTIYSGNNDFGTVQFADTATTGADSYRGVVAYKHGDEYMYFSTNATEKLRITSAGLVGIGTSSPGALLHLNQSGTGDYSSIRVSNTGASGRAYEIGVGGNTSAAGYANNLYFYDSTDSALRMVLDSSGRLGIGTTSPSAKLEVVGGNIRLDNNQGVEWGGVNNYIYGNESTDFIAVATNGNERARIDDSGRLLVGTSSVRSTGFTTQVGGEIFQEITNYGGITLFSNTNQADSAYITLGHSRGTTVGSNTVVASGDVAGGLVFQGTDGTQSLTAARITAFIDGTPGANDMPGRLVFSTTADGAASPTERLRITSAGVLQIADAGNITVGTTTGTKIGTATTQKLGFYNATPVVQPTAVADATDAATVITQLNDLLAKLRTLGIIAT